MPNYCWNSLHIDGTEEAVNRFVESVSSKDTALDFNKIKPFPEELNGIGIQGIVDGGPSEFRTINGKQVFLTEKEKEHLTEKYGATNWYDWSRTNWGTKWNTEDASVDVCGKSASFNFESALSPPIAVIDTASAANPDLEFEMEFEQDGDCFKGTASWSKGEQTSYNCDNYDPED